MKETSVMNTLPLFEGSLGSRESFRLPAEYQSVDFILTGAKFKTDNFKKVHELYLRYEIDCGTLLHDHILKTGGQVNKNFDLIFVGTVPIEIKLAKLNELALHHFQKKKCSFLFEEITYQEEGYLYRSYLFYGTGTAWLLPDDKEVLSNRIQQEELSEEQFIKKIMHLDRIPYPGTTMPVSRARYRVEQMDERENVKRMVSNMRVEASEDTTDGEIGVKTESNE